MESILSAIDNHPWTFFWCVIATLAIISEIGSAFKKDNP